MGLHFEWNILYLTFKNGRMYWHFTDFEEVFDLMDDSVLWYKLRRKSVRETMINCGT
jgi:hypothetical protein